MAETTPSQRNLAAGLTALKALQEGGAKVFKTDELNRTHRKALQDNGFLKPVMRGWYMSSRPEEKDGESTAWYASASEFLARYCEDKFGDQWCLSEDYSVRLVAGNSTVPPQVVVHAPGGFNSSVPLPNKHSILDYKSKNFPAPDNRTVIVGGLRAMKLEHALTRLQENFYRTNPNDAQIVLMSLRDSAELARQLLVGGQSVVAGRLAGALRACGRDELANDLLATMRGVGYVVTETNPFAEPLPYLKQIRGEAPCVTRIRLMWKSMREAVVAIFPEAPGLPTNVETYMAEVKDSYVRDAYNSLSIEGYRVTDELIVRVSSGNWSPDTSEADVKSKDAMAARGYYLARQEVEQSLIKILAGANVGKVVERDHRAWYRALFTPSVDAKILSAQDLAGYRAHQVFIRNAAHVPPSKESVLDGMPTLFELLEEEESPAVRAVLGHFIFVYIHPYMDGNGRMGRFLMNSMLASGGYPWTVIEVEHRTEYMDALNAASSKENIKPFARFIADSLAREKKLQVSKQAGEGAA